MKKLHKLVIKSFIGPFILTFFFVVFILLMQFLWRYIDDLIGKGLELPVILEFIVYTSASLVPMAAPLAVLLASLMTFGNLAENLELLALKASGVSLLRIMLPQMIVVIGISLAAFFFANNVMPVTNLKMKSLLWDIQQQRPELTIKPGVFDNTLEGYSIRIGERDSRTSLLTDILIFDHTMKKGNVKVTIADSGYMRMTTDDKHLVLTLYSGKSYYEMQKEKKSSRNEKSYPHRRDYFSEQEMLIKMSGFGLNRSDESLFKSSYQMMNIDQLHHFEDSLTTDLDQIKLDFLGNIERTLQKKPKKSLIQNKKTVNRDVEPIQTSALRKRDTLVKTPMSHEFRTITALDTINGKAVMPLHVDSLFQVLGKDKQHRAITMAINFARNNKSITSSNASTCEWKTSKLRRYQNEIQRKYTMSLLCIVFFFIGAPLGAIIRKGGLGMPVIASVLLFLIYYVISITGEKFARDSMLSPFMGMWISTFILGPVGAWLTYKAATDSVVLNLETYTLFFKRVARWFTKSNKKQ